MSADNWTVCPVCEVARQADIKAEREKVAAAYGTVSVEDFDQMRADLTEKEAAAAPDTWREDWEIGLFNGELFIDYRGHCSQCQTARKFRHTEQVAP